MNPSFQEAPISRIRALRFLQQLGYSYLSAPGKGRFPWSHSPLIDKLRGLGQSPISAGWRVAGVTSIPG